MKELFRDRRVRLGTVIYVAFLFVLLLLSNLSPIRAWIGKINDVFSSVILGLILSYLLNPIFRFFEVKALGRMTGMPKLRRALALFLTYIAFFVAITLVMLAIVPQLLGSILSFVGNFNDYLDTLVNLLNVYVVRLNARIDPTDPSWPFEPFNAEIIRNTLNGVFEDFINSAKDFTAMGSEIDFGKIFSAFGGAVGAVTDFIFGIFISIYVLSSKEKRYAQIKRLRWAYLDREQDIRMMHVINTFNNAFGEYFKLRLMDSVLLWVLSITVLGIAGMPYGILLATVMALGAMLPILGPLLGGGVALFLVLLVQPTSFVTALILILLIELVNSYLLAPRLIGTDNGLSFLFVLATMVVVVNFWGFFGLLFGLPLFSALYRLLQDYSDRKLEQKGYSANGELLRPEKKRSLFRRWRDKMEKMNAEEQEKGVRSFQTEAYRIAKKYNMLPSDRDPGDGTDEVNNNG